MPGSRTEFGGGGEEMAQIVLMDSVLENGDSPVHTRVWQSYSYHLFSERCNDTKYSAIFTFCITFVKETNKNNSCEYPMYFLVINYYSIFSFSIFQHYLTQKSAVNFENIKVAKNDINKGIFLR